MVTILEEARQRYSTDDVWRMLLRSGEPDADSRHLDPVALLSLHYTGQTEDLSEAEDSFSERLGCDFYDRTGEQNGGAKRAFPVSHDSAPVPKNTRKDPCGQKTRTNYVPWKVLMVVSYEELRNLLINSNQDEWTTPSKINGLFLLMDFIIRKHKAKGFPISGELARDYVSAINHPKNTRAIREPLDVLLKIGILERRHKAVCGPHSKTSATYRIPADLLRRKTSTAIQITESKAEKMRDALARNERRLNKKHPFRGQLLRDLERASLSDEGRDVAHDLISLEQKVDAVKRVQAHLNGDRQHTVRIDPVGQITTHLGSCPKELKPHLQIDGSPVANCDISHAHHNLLPQILQNRIDHLVQKGADGKVLLHYRIELARLQTFLSHGDYYQKWCVDPLNAEEREQKKLLITMMLNWKNEKARNNNLYRRMRARFPHTFQVIEDIKGSNHKWISTQLRHFTAKVIETALLELQAQGIPAFPDVDALICPLAHREKACFAIGRAMYQVTGVCCRVGGIRFIPPGDLVSDEGCTPPQEASE